MGKKQKKIDSLAHWQRQTAELLIEKVQISKKIEILTLRLKVCN
uniref:Uncharacterized protein n=1 Tax=Nelumbo nucifera TaxID=4432 RepID=A0A822ZQR3_NELNU|nr:TPA_asm: hypothetical protein HUJ06_003909 [Nelumbo nucifera]